MKPSSAETTSVKDHVNTALLAAFVGFAVLSSLSPLLQGCGQDLVVGGNVIVPTAAAAATPTETP